MGQYEWAFGGTWSVGFLRFMHRAAHEQLSVGVRVHDARACALYESALALWNMGFIEQARGKFDVLLAHSHELTVPGLISRYYSHNVGSSFNCSATNRRPKPMPSKPWQISTEKSYPLRRVPEWDGARLEPGCAGACGGRGSVGGAGDGG